MQKTTNTYYEIYWDDLTKEAKERLKNLNHENVDITPIAVIELTTDEDE